MPAPRATEPRGVAGLRPNGCDVSRNARSDAAVTGELMYLVQAFVGAIKHVCFFVTVLFVLVLAAMLKTE